jgi:iron complex outermembrane receptor protein
MKLRLSALACASATLLGGNIPVWAQEPSRPAPRVDAAGQTAPVVVLGYSPRYDEQETSFGNKTTDSIFEIPQAVVVLTEEIIREQSPQGLEGVIRNVSGVQSLGQFGGRQDHILFRGFEFGVNRNGLLRNGVQSVSRVQQDLGNLDQVEVLKGPSTLLYGRAEVGGLINLITRQPGSRPGVDLFARAGSYDDYSVGGRWDGELSDGVDASLFASGATRDSFKDDIFAERLVFNPAVGFDLAENWRLTIEGEQLNDVRRMDRGHIAYFPLGTTNTPQGGATVIRLPRERFLGDPNYDQNHYITSTGAVTLAYRADNIELTSVWSYGEAKEYRRNTEPSAFTSPAALAAGNMSRSLVDGETNQILGISDTYASIRYDLGGLSMETLAGGGYRYEEEAEARVSRRQFGLNINTLALIPLPAGQVRYATIQQTSDSNSFTNILFLYASQRVELTERLSVLAGLRFEDISQRIRNRTLRNPAGVVVTPAFTKDYNFDAIVPRIGVVFRPSEDSSIYANFTESFSQQNDAFLAGSAVDLERGRQIEVGAKAGFFGDRLLATAAVYEIEKTDITLPGPVPDTFIAVGEARSRGFELDVTGLLAPNWKVVAQYAYTDALTVRGGERVGLGAGTGAGNTVTGRPLPGVPDHSAGIWSNYEIETGPLAGLELGGGAVYVDRRAGTATAQFFLDDYVRLDASLGYTLGDTDFRLVISNVTDEEYYLGSRGNNNIEYGPPRNFVFTVRQAFN